MKSIFLERMDINNNENELNLYKNTIKFYLSFLNTHKNFNNIINIILNYINHIINHNNIDIIMINNIDIINEYNILYNTIKQIKFKGFLDMYLCIINIINSLKIEHIIEIQYIIKNFINENDKNIIIDSDVKNDKNIIIGIDDKNNINEIDVINLYNKENLQISNKNDKNLEISDKVLCILDNLDKTKIKASVINREKYNIKYERIPMNNRLIKAENGSKIICEITDINDFCNNKGFKTGIQVKLKLLQILKNV